ncbi:MAG: hypothetical protein P4L84_03400, partial [Isosphaeraceae bacterium]|nr:hypothetical protein [Isosphaeraceae bacterium]
SLEEDRNGVGFELIVIDTAPVGSTKEFNREQQGPPCARVQLDDNGQVRIALRHPIIESAEEPF